MATRKKKRHTPKGFRKVWFSKGTEKTAGLIVPSEKLAAMSVSDVSRLFPYSEATKMNLFHQSPEFDSWEAAFAYDTTKAPRPSQGGRTSRHPRK
jgi:hypothetical protein